MGDEQGDGGDLRHLRDLRLQAEPTGGAHREVVGEAAAVVVAQLEGLVGRRPRQALEHLIETGDYRAIATMWGVERGMIDKPQINGAGG